MNLYLKVQAGVMIPRCSVKSRQGHQCDGHMSIPLSLKQVAKIRSGERKAVEPNFTCNHKIVKKVIIEA